jgi:hypothetical protein
MTTSGVADFDLQFDDMIAEAYERCGIEVRDGYDMKTALRSLNLMFAEWANRGLNLWTIEQRSLPLIAGTYEYNLPADTVNALSAVIRTNAGLSTQQDITIDRISRAEWLHVPNKNTQSRPAQYYVQRSVPTTVYFYPAPDNTQQWTFVYYAIRRIENAGTYTNTADIVFRFLPALTAGLAFHLSVKKAPDRMQMLKALYEEEFARAATEDRDTASVFLVPTYTQR